MSLRNHAEIRDLPLAQPETSTDPRCVIVALWTGGSEIVDLPSDGSLLVGRDPTSAGVFMSHRSVSRRHARIDVRGGAVSIVDLGSVHGTKILGRRLDRGESVRLERGVFVDIGQAALVLQPACVEHVDEADEPRCALCLAGHGSPIAIRWLKESYHGTCLCRRCEHL